MSEQAPFDFGKLIPGFDFLRQLTAGNAAGAAAPGLAHWVAPTVSVEELDKRITELKAVQFWLEQNLLALKATVQALEVQKMTLATLRGMKVNVAEVAKAFSLPTAGAEPPAAAPAPVPESSAGWPFSDAAAKAKTAEGHEPAAQPEPESEPEPSRPAPKAASKAKAARAQAKAGNADAAMGVADPMQWWGALTQQFQQIAQQTLRDAARAVPTDEPAAAAASDADAPQPTQPAGKHAAGKAGGRAAKKVKRKAKGGKAVGGKPAAARKSPAKAPAKKAAPKKAAAKRPSSVLGWPLPPAFKIDQS